MMTTVEAERGKCEPSPRSDLFFAVLLLVFVFLSFSASRQESVTIDEFRHLSTGVNYWHTGEFSFDAATPPLWKLIMALPAYLAGATPLKFTSMSELATGWEPWFVATDFMRDNAAAYTRYLQSARLVNIMAATVCLLLLYRRSRQRFGPAAALYGTAFLALSPTMLAHSHYATTDVIATVTVLMVVFMLADYLQKQSPWRMVMVSGVYALSLLCKFTALLVAPLFVAVPLLVVWREGRRGGAGSAVMVRRAAFAVSTSLLLMVLTVCLLINLFYGFRGTGGRLADMELRSKTLASLRGTTVGTLPLPLPRGFVEGFDRQKADSDYAEFPSYFMGRWSVDGFRLYYLGAFLMKESVPFILLLAAAFLLWFRCRNEAGWSSEQLLYVYVPLTLFLVLSGLNRLNVGVRYLLPAYPYFCYFISSLYSRMSAGRVARLALQLLFVLHCVSVFRVAPCHTAYFNELWGGPENGYRYLIDSNLDWGQDLLRLKSFLTAQGIKGVQLAYFGHGLPEFYGIDYEPLTVPPKPGYVAISASLLQGQPYLLTYVSPPQVAAFDQYGYMRKLIPMASIGHSIMVYRIGESRGR